MNKFMVVALVAVIAALIGASAVATARVVFRSPRTFNYRASGGSISPYLVGYYDDREGSYSPADGGCDEFCDEESDVSSDDLYDVEPVLYLVNPTSLYLTAYVVVFDNDEDPVGCSVRELTPSDTTDIFLGEISGDDDEMGIVEVVSFNSDYPGERLEAGLKGWVTHYMEHDVFYDGSAVLTRESALQDVPASVLMSESRREDEFGNVEPSVLSTIVDFVNATCD